MQFPARSLALSQRTFNKVFHQGGRPLRTRKWTSHASSPESLTAARTGATASMNRLPFIVASIVCGASLLLLSKSTIRFSGEADAKPKQTSTFKAFDKSSLVPVGSPREVVSKIPMAKNLIRQDNLFDKMMEVEMVKEIHCFYDPNKKEFHSIVHLGKEVCGYPHTVHGGLTAAIVDETFGGLMFNIWKSGDLGFSLPAVTARLEVDYRNRLPQNSVVHCTTRLEGGKREGRSFWMIAELRDPSRDVTYATARACFVSPSWKKSAKAWLKGITGN